ncbi:hypothetical protein, variant 1 [Aphanomyces invadans]|uniref:Mannosyltransferase n=1 Tax=Aphanomyces invadans TaxID=157072 RepID=A0A024TXN0_9STRA|nr:hypothetical protein, variant 1 [Aphanomyces invadans]ETV98749.1 hypothetical protein, variant 1 [Aphanomyces invadans]|eukprot:XP_008872946.1 hypothetical protein, variant 1 [Aphanomyces invadans]
MAMWTLAACLVVFRVFNALFVRTYFNPDEFWQSSEVAHHMVFGYGYLTWEWQPHAQLRGYAHPAIFALLYKSLQLLGLDSRWAVAYGPRILEGVFTAITDIFLYKLARTYFDASTAKYALLCQISSWFVFFALSRTFSNSIEACCTTIALSYWPWHFMSGQAKRESGESTTERRHLRIAVAFAALGCIFRPTNAVLWVFLASSLLVRSTSPVSLILSTFMPIGVVSIAAMAVVDRIGYGEWTFVPFNFMKFNVLEGKDKLYGVHPWHWYFVAGFPQATATHLPLILYGVFLTQQRDLAAVVLWSLCVFSFGAHKEPRFLFPLLPASFVYAGKALHSLETRTFFKPVVSLLVAANGAAAVYFSRFHQVPRHVGRHGPHTSTRWAARSVGRARLLGRPRRPHRLDRLSPALPRHALVQPSPSQHPALVPHVHPIVRAVWWIRLTWVCSEREVGSPSDALRQDPLAFATARYAATPLPTYVVMYSSSAAALAESLAAWKFSLDQAFAHATVSLDADSPVPDTHMLVYSRKAHKSP